MDELPEETKEKYRRWWLSRSPEDRARLRALNGKPVTIHELVFLGDAEGFPLAAGPGSRGAGGPLAALHPSTDEAPGVLRLPEFLLDDEDGEVAAGPRPGPTS